MYDKGDSSLLNFQLQNLTKPYSLNFLVPFRLKLPNKQAEKLKSCEMKEVRIKNDEGWNMMISSCWGVLQTDRQMDDRTDICECRVAFATEKCSPAHEVNAALIHILVHFLVCIVCLFWMNKVRYWILVCPSLGFKWSIGWWVCRPNVKT